MLQIFSFFSTVMFIVDNSINEVICACSLIFPKSIQKEAQCSIVTSDMQRALFARLFLGKRHAVEEETRKTMHSVIFFVILCHFLDERIHA